MPMSRVPPYLIPLCWLALLSSSHAQNLQVPDAGTFRQWVDQQRGMSMPSAPAAKAPAPAPVKTPTSEPTVFVKEWAFEGNRLMSREALGLAVTAFTGQSLSFNDLKTVSDAVTQAYRDAGWLVQVNLPKQDVTAGRITLQIVEATMASVRFEGDPPKQVKPQAIQAIFEKNAPYGGAVRLDLLDRALLLSDDLPGVAITGALQAGQREGETELLLKASDEPAYFGDVAIDNTGSRFTGSQRTSLNLNFNSPTGRAELLNLALMHTQGTDYVRTGLTFPVGHNGLRLGANLSRVTYKVVSGLAEGSTPLRGKSDSLGLDAVYPWLRSREANLYLNSGLDLKTFFNEDTQVQSDYKSLGWRLGGSANLFDAWGGGGANSASLQLLGGRLSHLREDIPQSRLSRHYAKLSYALSRQQAVSAEHSLLVSLNGQHATEPLDSSERFYLGGANSVRAYPSSEAGGDRGQALSAEWRWKLNPEWVLTTFVDQARVVTLPQTPTDTAASLTLKGYGLSVAWSGPKGINTRLTWSRRIGQNPKPMDNGNDHDGTLRQNRLWLSAGMAF